MKCRPVGKGNENDIAPEAEKGSRAFRCIYGENKKLYFEVADVSIKRKLEYTLKHTPWFLNTFIGVGSAFFKTVGLFVKTDPNLILFTSFSGKQYNDSPKAIYEYLRSIPEGKSFKYVWAFEHPEDFSQLDCEKVKIDTWQYFITTLKAKYWVTSVNIERGLKYKKKNTFYLNTWHGASINLVGNAVAGRNDFRWDHINRFCISGNYERSFVERDFCVKPESLLLSGLPRNDELYHVTTEKIQTLRKRLNVPEGKKVILYAPTWRESTDGGASCDLKPPIDLDKWKERLGKDCVVFIRAHVNTREMLGIKYDDVIRNGSDYPAVNDLLMMADFLISDYSSIIMDYCILGRPIVCFGYDYEEYNKARGGFYFDLDKEIPSGVRHTEDDVLDYILNTNYSVECEKVKKFRNDHIEFGGEATKICVEEILKW